MRPASRTLLGLFAALLLIGSCVGGDAPTAVGDDALVRLAIQPALIPSAADGSALPIHRIRTVVARQADGVVLREQRFDVLPTDAAWTIDVDVPASGEPTVIVYLYLINVAGDGTETVQFSGRTPPITVTAGARVTGVDADIVRGPLSNLAVTGVTITSAPDTLPAGTTAVLTATVTTAGTAAPAVFWTSLDPAVLTVADSVATGVSPGTAEVVASAGAFADTATIVVIVPPVATVRVSPDSADVAVAATRTYTVELRDAGGNLLTGRAVTWTTGNGTIATVNSSGVVTAVAPGVTTVRATSEGVFDDAIVRVATPVVPVATVLVSPDSADVAVAGTRTYTVALRDASANLLTGRVVTWTTGSSAVATVNASTGVVTGVAPGTTTVRATSEGVFDDAIVRVPPPVTGGATNTWIPTSGLWSNAAKWSLGRVPIAGDTVLLTQSEDYSITMDVDATIAKLVVGSGATSTIDLLVGDRSLTITGTGAGAELDILAQGSVRLDNGTVTVSDLVNNGRFYTDGLASLVASSVTNAGQWTLASDAELFVSHPTSSDFQTSGTLTIDSGAVLVFGTNASLTYQGGSIVDTGLLIFMPGTDLTLDADLVLDGPNLELLDAATVAAGGDRLTIGPSSTLLLYSVSDTAEVGTKLVNQGNVLATGPASFFNDSLYVDVNAVVTVLGSGGVTDLHTVGVDNSGTIVLGGAGDTHFGPGANSQSLTNRPGGILEFAPGADRFLNGQLINQGEVIVAAPTTLHRETAGGNPVTANHVNTGRIDLVTGSLDIELGGSSPTFTNSDTITVGTGTTLSVSNLASPAGSIINAATGVLNGGGTVDVRTGVPSGINNGTIAPGLSPGTLTWMGSIPMGPTGRIEIELEGTTPGTGYDQLNASFDLLLDAIGPTNGTLNVTAPSFTPAAGDSFAVLTFASRQGNFATVNLPTFSGVTLDTVWAEGPGAVDTLFLVASASGPPQLTWTGAIDTDWSKAGNWNPAQVPTSINGVTIPSGPTNQPTLTASSVAGGVTIAGLGARLTIGGHTLTVGSLITHTDGLLVMTNAADLVDVTGSGAFFQGGDETGLLSAGELRVAGSFTQQLQTSNFSFFASGTHRTVMTGASLQSIHFCCGLPGSVFQDLDISTSAGINIQNNGFGVFVNGTLTSLVGAGPAPWLYTLGSPMTVRRFQVDKLLVDRGTLTLNEGGVPATQQFDNVTFQNYLPSWTQFAIVAPGGTAASRTLTFNNLQFQPLTTGNTGRYLNVTASSGTLIIALPGASPAGGNGPAFTTLSGGASVNWP